RVEMQCNRRTAFDDFEGGERSFPRAEVGMTPGPQLAGFRELKAEHRALLHLLSSEFHDRGSRSSSARYTAAASSCCSLKTRMPRSSNSAAVTPCRGTRMPENEPSKIKPVPHDALHSSRQ